MLRRRPHGDALVFLSDFLYGSFPVCYNEKIIDVSESGGHMDSYKITFLAHSGFALELSDCVLVFDLYKDPAGALPGVFDLGKPVYFFVSHIHGDHFNPSIYQWKEKAVGYILHKDCVAGDRTGAAVHFMDVGEDYETPQFAVHMYGSTDAGGSYMIHHGDDVIFHAGDLNWWHWAGEEDGDNREARRWYFEELSKIREKAVDLAFFPVDARQEVAREWGVEAFLDRTIVKERLIPMHAFGTRWCPSYRFRWHYDVPLWIPSKEGDLFVK